MTEHARGDAPELAPLMPALLDALAYAGTGITVIADRGAGLERWYANEAAAAILGYELAELLAVPAIETIAPEQRGLATQLSSGFRAGQPLPTTFEYLGLHKDGSRVDMVMNPLMGPLDEASIEELAAFFASQPHLHDTAH